MTDHIVQLVRSFIELFSSGNIWMTEQSSMKRVISRTPVDTSVRVGCHCHLLLLRSV